MKVLPSHLIRQYLCPPMRITKLSFRNSDAKLVIIYDESKLYPGSMGHKNMRLWLLHQSGSRTAHGAVLRRQSLPFAKLFRRPDKKGNRQNSLGAHPACSDVESQGTAYRNRQDHQRDSLRPRLQLPTSSKPLIQEDCRNDTRRIPSESGISTKINQTTLIFSL